MPDLLAQFVREEVQDGRLALGTAVVSSSQRRAPHPGMAEAVLFTAPHSLYLRRQGHAHHVPEKHTAALARRFAAAVGGSFLTWKRREERRVLDMCEFVGEPDATNADPNFTHYEELESSPWTRKLLEVRRCFGPDRPCLHVDLHGCQEPRPGAGADLVVGLRAMDLIDAEGCMELREGLAEAFSLILEGFTVNVRPQKFLTGASPDPKRMTLTQQSLSERGGGWTHAVQLEMSPRLRKALIGDKCLSVLLAKAITMSWSVSCIRTDYVEMMPLNACRKCAEAMASWVVLCKQQSRKRRAAIEEARVDTPEVSEKADDEDSDERDERFEIKAGLSGNTEPPPPPCEGLREDGVLELLAKAESIKRPAALLTDVSMVRAAARTKVDKDALENLSGFRLWIRASKTARP